MLGLAFFELCPTRTKHALVLLLLICLPSFGMKIEFNLLLVLHNSLAALRTLVMHVVATRTSRRALRLLLFLEFPCNAPHRLITHRF